MPRGSFEDRAVDSRISDLAIDYFFSLSNTSDQTHETYSNWVSDDLYLRAFSQFQLQENSPSLLEEMRLETLFRHISITISSIASQPLLKGKEGAVLPNNELNAMSISKVLDELRVTREFLQRFKTELSVISVDIDYFRERISVPESYKSQVEGCSKMVSMFIVSVAAALKV